MGVPGAGFTAAGFVATGLSIGDLTKVVVDTFDETGTSAEEAFHLLVTC